jgi:hypothetical protein
MSTPRIKLKHNDISDEEFRILMTHGRRIMDVSIQYLLLYYNLLIFFFYIYIVNIKFNIIFQTFYI